MSSCSIWFIWCIWLLCLIRAIQIQMVCRISIDHVPQSHDQVVVVETRWLLHLHAAGAGVVSTTSVSHCCDTEITLSWLRICGETLKAALDRFSELRVSQVWGHHLRA